MKIVQQREYTPGIGCTQSRIGLCDECGERVCLDGFTNTCDCGADYNMSGQRLADRSQWGEETGETLADILRETSDDAGDY